MIITVAMQIKLIVENRDIYEIDIARGQSFVRIVLLIFNWCLLGSRSNFSIHEIRSTFFINDYPRFSIINEFSKYKKLLNLKEKSMNNGVLLT